MKITADTKQYRTSITDPVSEKKRKLNFPLSGTITEKRQQVKEIKSYIIQCKVEIKKLEVRALLAEAEACRKLKYSRELELADKIGFIRNKERNNPVAGMFEQYKRTDSFKNVTAATQYQREKYFTKFIKFLQSKNIHDVEQVTPNYAVSFMNDLDCKASTYNKYLLNLSSVFKSLNIDNPFKNISSRNEEQDTETKKPFTDTEIKNIFSKFSDDWKDICGRARKMAGI